jgi:acyl-CoA synthetase (AMP-forming)/AMP-acid ligase II
MATVTLDQLFQRQVAMRGDKIALRFERDALTYGDLDRRATQIAHGLRERGIGPGDRVAYLGKNSLAYLEYFLGAMKARIVTVPVNWRLAEPEIAYVLDNSRARMVLVESQFDALAAKIAPDIPRLVTGEALDTFAAWRDRQRARAVTVGTDVLAPVLQLYTSGTTGRPKGAVLTHRSLLGLRADPELMPDWYRWSCDDVSLIAMPVAHISGTGWAIWTLQEGATGIISREFDPNALFDQMVRNRINKVMLVPTAMQIAVRHPQAAHTDFGFLRYVYYGGAPLPAALLAECQAVFRCGFVQMYGMTETSGTIVALAPEDHDPANGARLRSVGKALPGVELKIIDIAGNELPVGSSGEIATRSPSNMTGYFEMRQATAETIDAAGWLRTGDVGYIDADGYLFLQDRAKDLIISGGENIYPAEVENAIYGHPAVSEVAVVGVPDEKWGEAVKAVVVLAAGAQPDEAGIIAWAAERIARYKLPKSVDFVSALPRNHTGKVLRRELRDHYRGLPSRH